MDMKPRRNSTPGWTSYWTLAASLTLLLLIGVYVLGALQEEHIRHFSETSVLTITEDDRVFFGRNPIAISDFPRKVKRFRDEEGSEKVLHIWPGRLVNHSTVVLTVATIQEAGHSRLHLGLLDRGEMLQSASIGPEVSVLLVECAAGTGQDKEPHGIVAAQGSVSIPLVHIERAATADYSVELSLNSQPVSTAQLSIGLEQMLNQRRERVVHIEAGKLVQYGDVADLMAMAQQAGAMKIGLVRDCDREPPASANPGLFRY